MASARDLLKDIHSEWTHLYGKLQQVKDLKAAAIQFEKRAKELLNQAIEDQANADLIENAIKENQVVAERVSHLQNEIIALNLSMKEVKEKCEAAIRRSQRIIIAVDQLTSDCREASAYRKGEMQYLAEDERAALMDVPKMQAILADLQKANATSDNLLENLPGLLDQIRCLCVIPASVKLQEGEESELQQLVNGEKKLKLLADFTVNNARANVYYDQFVAALQQQMQAYKDHAKTRYYVQAEQRNLSIDLVNGKIEELQAIKAKSPAEAFDKLLALVDEQIAATEASHNQALFSRLFTNSSLVTTYRNVLKNVSAEDLAASRARIQAAAAQNNPVLAN